MKAANSHLKPEQPSLISVLPTSPSCSANDPTIQITRSRHERRYRNCVFTRWDDPLQVNLTACDSQNGGEVNAVGVIGCLVGNTNLFIIFGAYLALNFVS